MKPAPPSLIPIKKDGKVVGHANLSREEAQRTDRRALRVLGAREVATQTAASAATAGDAP